MAGGEAVFPDRVPLMWRTPTEPYDQRSEASRYWQR